ncbi:hypothetical protein [Streptomyces peucetius]|uniref:Lipoprotein n=1 Tax=Streptomyces peucetius TaxID=1950 RepID=A0ABY6I1G4_STRPE|nr:hypothetical protein [Streptomyces peucetius]UYQ60713.1 hypothetical protein OGH68_04040 [Streptomyces peucetius]
MRHHFRHEEHGSEPLPEVWTGRATNRMQWLLAVAGGGCLALGVKLAVDATWTTGIAALLMAVIGCFAAGIMILYGTLAFVYVVVRIDRHALDVRCGHIGVPRRHIPLSHVVSADFAPRVTPRQWGGWGCRWRPERGTAVVVRRGEGLVVTLDDGGKFTVTVDDAATAVRTVRARLARMEREGTSRTDGATQA